MKKKLLAVVLTLAMVVSFMPTMAFASGSSQAWNVSKGENATTITLTGNINFTASGNESVAVGNSGNLIIDLAGYTWTATYNNAADPAVTKAALMVTAGNNITLKDSSTNKTGKLVVELTGTPEAKVQAAGVSVQQGGKFILESGTITATKPETCESAETFGVLVIGKTDAITDSEASSFTMNGGTVKAEYGVRVLYEGAAFTMHDGTVEGDLAVSGHGDAQGNTSINILGGNIKGNYQGIYHPQTGTLNISGGTITGWGGVEVKSGTVTISNATITATGKKGQYSDYNMGTSSVGYAVAVVEDNDYKGGNVTINSGSFTGGVALLNSAKEEVYNSAELKIKSGVFDDKSLYDNLTGDVCKSATTTSGEYTVAQSHNYDPKKTEITKTPTCTETGVEKVFCTVCGKEGEEYTREVSALNHDYSIWQSNTTQHWKKCSRCDATTEKENHESNSVCTTCGYNCAHTSVTEYAGKAATCSTEGYEPYVVCNDCGKHVLKDADSTSQQITYTVTSDSLVTIPKLAHTYSYEHNSSQHWQVCSVCNDTTAKLDHEYSGRTCTVCGYVKSKSSDGSSSGTTTNTNTITNSDGSTTTTETKSDGTKVETTTYKDGSTTKVETKTETKSDGTKVETQTTKTTKADGTKTEIKSETVTAKDGTTTKTETAKTTDANGSTATTTTVTDKTGVTTVKAEAEISTKAVEAAQKDNTAVTVPVEVKATTDTKTAPTVEIKIDVKSSGSTAASNTIKVEVPVTNVNSGTVAVLVKEDGTEEIIKTSVPTENGVTINVSGNVTVKIVDNSQTFADTTSHWSKDEVNFVASRNLFNGVGGGNFGVAEPMTRGMVNTVLARLAGEDTTGGEHWYDKGSEWAVRNGVSDGTNPTASVTREQLATMLCRYAGSPEVTGDISFADSSAISKYAKNALLWATQKGIMDGMGDGTIAPSADAQRAQVAAMMARFLETM